MTATGFAAMLPVIWHFIIVIISVDGLLLLELSESSSVLELQVEAGMNSLIIKCELGNNRTSVGVTNKCVVSQFRVVSQNTGQEVEPICIAVSPAEIHPRIRVSSSRQTWGHETILLLTDCTWCARHRAPSLAILILNEPHADWTAFTLFTFCAHSSVVPEERFSHSAHLWCSSAPSCC